MNTDQVKRFFFQDFRGIKGQFSFEPGTVTFIRGANGTGKTSLTAGIAYLFDGGGDASVIRTDDRNLPAVVGMELADGTKWTKTTWIDKNGALKYELVGINPAGIEIPSPQKSLNQLASGMAMNPGRLLKMDVSTAAGKRALMTALLETMPIEFTPDDFYDVAPRLLESAGGGIQSGAAAALNMIGTSLPKGKIGLEAVAQLRKAIGDTRRKVGVERDENLTTAGQLERDTPKAEDAATAKRRAAEIEAEAAEVIKAHKVEEEGIRDDFTADERALRAEFQEALNRIAEKKAETLRLLDVMVSERLAPLKAEQSALVEKVAAANRAEATRATIATMRKRGNDKAGEYDRYTTAIEILDAAREKKLKNLPIPGVDFTDDGDVTVDGVPWAVCNTARLAEIAVQHCGLIGGTLPLIVDDNSEKLDADTKAALNSVLVANGYQVIYADVAVGEPLNITVQEGV
jgi:hypothetical protein